jgi:hypothetical protein
MKTNRVKINEARKNMKPMTLFAAFRFALGIAFSFSANAQEVLLKSDPEFKRCRWSIRLTTPKPQTSERRRTLNWRPTGRFSTMAGWHAARTGFLG